MIRQNDIQDFKKHMSKTIIIRFIIVSLTLYIIETKRGETHKKGKRPTKRKKYITIFEDVICKKIATISTLAQQIFYKIMNSNLFKTKIEWWKNLHPSNKQRFKEKHKDNKECEEIKQKSRNVRVW